MDQELSRVFWTGELDWGNGRRDLEDWEGISSLIGQGSHKDLFLTLQRSFSLIEGPEVILSKAYMALAGSRRVQTIGLRNHGWLLAFPLLGYSHQVGLALHPWSVVLNLVEREVSAMYPMMCALSTEHVRFEVEAVVQRCLMLEDLLLWEERLD
jgi:hypothetical protein